MRSQEAILVTLSKNAGKPEYIFKDLYRILYNPMMYVNAYERIKGNEGNMTPGVDKGTIDGFSLEKIDIIISTIKDESYQPNPAKRQYIKKKGKGGKLRPLGIPSFTDKVVQEVVKTILESIYEGHFSEFSHGFRPQRSCKTLLESLKARGTGVKWWIEGDIKGFFDNIDHNILINILRRKIKDERFIALIWKFLRAGYVEDWVFKNSYSGTPQGGILSPLLSNIYLNEFDQFAESLISEFNCGSARRKNPEWKRLESRRYKLKSRNAQKWDKLSPDAKSAIVAERKSLLQRMLKLPGRDPIDSSLKRLIYFRYADDFICGVIGSKDDAEAIKSKFSSFLTDNLKLELSLEKTVITHGTHSARFLGYDISVGNSVSVITNKNGHKSRNINGHVLLKVPHDKIRDFLLRKKVLKINNDGVWHSTHRTQLTVLSDLEIIDTFNAEIRGVYNYYNLAYNVSNLNGTLNYIMRYSCFKTLASKHKTSISKLNRNKHYKNHKGVFGVWFETKVGQKFREFYNDGFTVVKKLYKHEDATTLDTIIHHGVGNRRSSPEQRLLAQNCDWCGAAKGSDVKLEIHHVRKLKDLKGKKNWEQTMIARRRKTMVLCIQPNGNGCHSKLHSGKLD